jgi:A/G-specific adenine glycosylase
MPNTSTFETADAARFRRPLTRWYRENGRHQLPWRLTRDPYAVLVSEVMLQQTQVERVLPYYTAWLERWPDFATLASAPASEVIRAWRGLGYNRRALNLHRLAVKVTEQHAGALPGDLKALLALPGVGEYTASAVRCFAFEAHVVVADTNIARVVARACLGAADQHEAPAAELRRTLANLLPATDARDHNLALMDLGAMVCQARSPACSTCPLVRSCHWRAIGYPAPIRVRPSSPPFETTARFARGRIIDALREAPATFEELGAMLPERHRPRVAALLDVLAEEGMVVRDGASWRLPG